jgi:hypothetical protein
MGKAKDIGAIVTTVLVFLILAWTLVYVFKYIDSTPQVGTDGKVVLDKFGNSKTILLAILPLTTTAVGYWLGNKGAGAAQDDAKKANDQKNESPRQVRRLQFLRGWSHGTTVEQLSA